MSLYSDTLEFVVRHMPPDTHLGDVLACVEEVAALVLRGATPLPPPEAVTHTKVTPAPEAQPKKPAEPGGDTLAPEEFFETECYHGGWVTAKDLYGAYVAFAAAQDLEPLSGVKFGRAARERFTYRKTAAGGKYETSVEGVDHNA